MTRKEAINKWIIPAIKNTWNAKKCKEILEALEQEPIDYKTQYENYLKKSEVVISQLRADRDRLQDAFDKLRAEIKQYQSDYDVHGTEYDRTAWKAFN